MTERLNCFMCNKHVYSSKSHLRRTVIVLAKIILLHRLLAVVRLAVFHLPIRMTVLLYVGHQRLDDHRVSLNLTSMNSLEDHRQELDAHNRSGNNHNQTRSSACMQPYDKWESINCMYDSGRLIRSLIFFEDSGDQRSAIKTHSAIESRMRTMLS